MSVKPRTSIETLPPYRAARSVETLKREYGLKSITKLAANENTFGFSKNVWKALKQISSQYPDGSAYNLRSELAKKFNLPLENIVLGNGSFELLYLAGIAYLNQGDETIAALPSFGWYKSVTQILGANFTGVPLKDFHVDLTAIAGAVTEKTKIIWLCNPNNPTGTIFTQSELENFLQKIPDRVLVILDEAYIDYVEEKDFPDSIPLLKKHDNILILRTFSKTEGLAGFRVGYGFADEKIISSLNKVRIPSNVNSPAQYAALASLHDESFKERTLKNAHEQKQVYYKVFDEFGFSYVISNTNFIFFDVGRNADSVVEEFLKEGILLRSGSEYGFPTMIRLTIGRPEENSRVIAILRKIFGGKNV